LNVIPDTDELLMNFGISVPSYLGLGAAFAATVTAVLHVAPVASPLAAPFKGSPACGADFWWMTILHLRNSAHVTSVSDWEIPFQTPVVVLRFCGES
jgi:hypothetical protein